MLSTVRTLAICRISHSVNDALAQLPPDVAMERSGYVIWLKEGPNSPLSPSRNRKSVRLRLGPADADIPLAGLPEYRVYPSGSGLVLEGSDGKRPVGRGSPSRIGKYALYFTGPQPGTVMTVFSDSSRKEPPGYYEYDPTRSSPAHSPDPKHLHLCACSPRMESRWKPLKWALSSRRSGEEPLSECCVFRSQVVTSQSSKSFFVMRAMDTAPTRQGDLSAFIRSRTVCSDWI